MRSLSMVILPFCRQSATKKNRNRAIKSIPIILATQRMIVTERVDPDAVRFMFTSDLSVEFLVALKLIRLFAANAS